MNDKDDMNERESPVESDPQNDEAVAQLMSLAGPRPRIPVDVQRRVHANVRQEWQQATKRRQVVRWSGAFTLAASILLAVTLSFRPIELPARKLGSIVRVVGAIDGDNITSGHNVRQGDTITTVGGQSVSILMNGGLSLRVAANSSLHFQSADNLSLMGGKIYVDSGQAIYRDHGITINTLVGSARDIGTQFAVEYIDDNMAVAVREGRVDVLHDQETYLAVAGEKLLVRADTKFVVTPISTNDRYWDWAVELAPTFEIQDRPLLDFLKWAARELGKELVFADSDARMAAMRTVLSGSVENFAPDEATRSVLSTTNFHHRISELQIIISR